MHNCTKAHPPCRSTPGAELASQQIEFAEISPSDLALLQLPSINPEPAHLLLAGGGFKCLFLKSLIYKQ